MNAQEREAFWKTLCALPGLDLSQDAKQLMAAIRFPKLLFRYRPVNLNSLEALRTNRLYFSSANYYDDPFDTFLHIDIDSIHQEFLTAFQTRESTEAVTEGVKDILGGMLWGGLIARVICCSPCSDTAPEPPNPVPFHGKSLSEPPLENTSIKKRSKEQA